MWDRRCTLICVSLCLWCAVFCLAETSPDETIEAVEVKRVLTLRQALALTLVENPELKAYSLEIRAAEARKLQAGLGPNPQLKIEVEEAGGAGERSGFDGAETTIELSQRIEFDNRSQKREKVASVAKELADIDYENKKLDVFCRTAQAFIEVLKAQEKVGLSEELLKLAEASFKTVDKRVETGKDSPVEKTRAAVSLANIKMAHQKSQRALVFARKKLASFWAEDTAGFERATGHLDDIEAIPALNDLTRHLKQNPGYARWAVEIEKSQAALALEKSKAKGSMNVGVGVQRFNETDDNAVTFGISIPLPLSNRNQGAKEAARYDLAKSHELQKGAWLKLQNNFNQTYQKLADAYSQAISLKEEVLPAASEMFDAATQAYREGKVDYLNVLDAQRTLFDIKDQYIESLADYHIAKIDMDGLLGNQIRHRP